MAANLAARQNLAARLADTLRLYEHEIDDVGLHKLARSIGSTPRDLRRWADGTTLPGEVFSMLLGALPEHLADILIAPTGRRLIAQDHNDDANPLLVASLMSRLSSDIAERHSDGVFCHVDKAETRAQARRLLPKIEELARDPGE